METVIMESEETSIMKSLHIEEKLKYLTTAHGTRYLFGILVLITIMVAVFRIQEKVALFGVEELNSYLPDEVLTTHPLLHCVVYRCSLPMEGRGGSSDR